MVASYAVISDFSTAKSQLNCSILHGHASDTDLLANLYVDVVDDYSTAAISCAVSYAVLHLIAA